MRADRLCVVMAWIAFASALLAAGTDHADRAAYYMASACFFTLWANREERP